METNSFGEDLVVKTRKPYTITKQREKWTEEEHNRFLEALKLYGRAWQRIEEHIGTKTAIQIRSHAQKFFTKLEKEAVATGSPLGQAHDIDIPPPRPKKKPNYPYPRKTASFCSILPPETAAEKISKTMSPQPQEINKQEAAKSLQQAEECSDEAQCSVVLNLFQDAPSSSSIPSMGNKGCSKNQLKSFREYVSTVTRPKEPPKNKSSLTIEVNMESNQDPGRPTSGISMELSCGVHESKGTVENGDSHTIPAAPAFHTSSMSSHISHPFPTFAPDSCQSLAGIPPAFSSQIVSALLRNPAVHAAACMAAASIWPPEEMAPDPSSTAAIAAATVAAASAWWAINGLIPLFPPPPPATPFPAAYANHAPPEKMEERHAAHQNSSSEQNFPNPNPSSDAKTAKHERSSCGSNTTSSSDIETNAVLKKNGKAKDEAKQPHFQNLLLAGEANTRRARGGGGGGGGGLCFNETWKEVSQEGRLAFQALFTRDILPQSFVTQLGKPEMELQSGNNLKARRTGFKPYKRCSAEAEVHKSSANEETNNKKIRLQEGLSS